MNARHPLLVPVAAVAMLLVGVGAVLVFMGGWMQGWSTTDRRRTW